MFEIKYRKIVLFFGFILLNYIQSNGYTWNIQIISSL